MCKTRLIKGANQSYKKFANSYIDVLHLLHGSSKPVTRLKVEKNKFDPKERTSSSESTISER
jgi:hypothetical protein